MSGPRGASSGLGRYLPALGWLGGYEGSWLRGDLVAGVTTAAVVIPQAMAYATFISAPVLAGFKAGVGLLITAGQLGKVLGVPQEGDSFFAPGWRLLPGFPAGGELSQTAVN